jgi:general secretion pathway protein L
VLLASALPRLRGLAGGFLAWWMGELRALVPARLRRLLAADRRGTVLDLAGPQPVVRARNGGREEELGRFATSDDPALRRLLRRRRRRDRLTVRIPPARALFKRIELPLAARENLAQVLAFEMDRLTPFKAAEVRFGYRVLASDAATRRLAVELEVVPRPVVEAALDTARGLGVRPARIEAAAGVNLLPDEAQPGHGYRRLNLALAGLALVLAALAAYLPLERQRASLRTLQAELAVVRAEAEAAMALREAVDERLAARDRVVAQRLATPLAVELLDELTARLPDHSWALELTLRGYSAAASELIGLLEASERFRRAQFRSPVTQDPRVERERFNLSAEIAGEDG